MLPALWASLGSWCCWGTQCSLGLTSSAFPMVLWASNAPVKTPHTWNSHSSFSFPDSRLINSVTSKVDPSVTELFESPPQSAHLSSSSPWKAPPPQPLLKPRTWSLSFPYHAQPKSNSCWFELQMPPIQSFLTMSTATAAPQSKNRPSHLDNGSSLQSSLQSILCNTARVIWTYKLHDLTLQNKTLPRLPTALEEYSRFFYHGLQDDTWPGHCLLPKPHDPLPDLLHSLLYLLNLSWFPSPGDFPFLH